MQVLTKIAISALMTIASFSAFADAAGEQKVKAALENTIEKIQSAVKLSEEGKPSSQINQDIADARQLQKEFRYEQTERQRQKANDKLRIARDAFEAGDKAAADKTLKEALDSFIEMKKTYDAAHK